MVSPLVAWNACGNSAVRKRSSSATVIAACGMCPPRPARSPCFRMLLEAGKALPNRSVSGLSVELAQLVLRLHQGPLARRGKVSAGAIDVEGQHRQRGAERIGLAALAAFRRAFERGGNALGALLLEAAAFEVERVA